MVVVFVFAGVRKQENTLGESWISQNRVPRKVSAAAAVLLYLVGGLDGSPVRLRIGEGNSELDHVRPALLQRREAQQQGKSGASGEGGGQSKQSDILHIPQAKNKQAVGWWWKLLSSPEEFCLRDRSLEISHHWCTTRAGSSPYHTLRASAWSATLTPMDTTTAAVFPLPPTPRHTCSASRSSTVSSFLG